MRATRAYLEGFERGIRPPPRMTVSEWADLYRVLPSQSSAEPGPWRTGRTPYLREIMDSLGVDSPVEIVVLKKGAQVGGTEAGNNWLGYIMHYAPAPTLLVLPTVELAKRSSKQRIAPMIEAVPELRQRVKDPRSRDSGNTMLAKEFPGGILIATGSNSAVGLRSIPARNLFMDELAAFADDAGGEGDSGALATRRTATYGRNRKIFKCSTPNYNGDAIDVAYEESDKREYYVPCPECGLFQPITWARLEWDKDEPATVGMACSGCKVRVPEHRKAWMLSRGEWVSTAESETHIRGYHLSALYSPLGWYSWEQAVRDFLAAKDAGREQLKTWTNTVLGESWEEESEAVDPFGLFARRIVYPAPVPAPAVVLTAGIDTQDDRLEITINGYGYGERCYVVDHRVLSGSPGEPDVWRKLDDILLAPFEHESGVQMRVSAACIDSGGHFTQQVYTYVMPRQSRRVYAIKGMAGEGRPIVSAPIRKNMRRNDPRKLDLFTVGVDSAKGLIYSRLSTPGDAAGVYRFPATDAFDEEYFAQLCGERREPRYRKGVRRLEWVPQYPRLEALDNQVYALAALYILAPNFERLTQAMGTAEKAPKSAHPLVGPVRRRPWVSSWKDD